MKKGLVAMVLAGWAIPAPAGDLVPERTTAPDSIEALYRGFDPRQDSLDIEVVRTWKEEGVILRYVVYTVGDFKGRKARMAGFYGFPKGGKRLPALLHMHGGGQRAFLQEVRRFAGRGL